MSRRPNCSSSRTAINENAAPFRVVRAANAGTTVAAQPVCRRRFFSQSLLFRRHGQQMLVAAPPGSVHEKGKPAARPGRKVMGLRRGDRQTTERHFVDRGDAHVSIAEPAQHRRNRNDCKRNPLVGCRLLRLHYRRRHRTNLLRERRSVPRRSRREHRDNQRRRAANRVNPIPPAKRTAVFFWFVVTRFIGSKVASGDRTTA